MMSCLLWFVVPSLGAEPTAVVQDAVDDLQPFMHSSRDVTCASSRVRGPPAGALAIQASPLGWVQRHREGIRLGQPTLPDPTEASRWLETTTAYPGPETMALAASVSPIGGDPGHYSIAVEARAWQRAPALFPNFTIVVDTSPSMGTVFTRALPPLQDEAEPAIAYRPVGRDALLRASLDELLARIPPQSKVSIVAMDGLNARVAMTAGSVVDTLAMERALPRLVPGYVRGYHPGVHEELERISDLTFTPCHDNRVVILTDHVTEVFQREAIRSVARWGAGDVDVWSFGVGVGGDMRAQLAALTEAAGGAAWLINARSDAATIWDSMLDPGGVVHLDAQIGLELPEGTRWREHRHGPWMTGAYRRFLGDVTSGTGWARVVEVQLPEGAEPRFVAEATYSTIEEVQHAQRLPIEPVPLVSAAGWARNRTVLHHWAEGRGAWVSMDLVDPDGQGSELLGWMAHVDPAFHPAWEPTAANLTAEELAARRQVLRPPTVDELRGTLPCRAQDDASRELPECDSTSPRLGASSSLEAR